MPQVQGPDIGQGRRKAFMRAVGMTLVAGFVQVLPGDGPRLTWNVVPAVRQETEET